jgi:hypothetical protein
MRELPPDAFYDPVYAAINAETRRVMGVVIGEPLIEYTPAPDKWAFLGDLMSIEEAEARAAADVARVREIMRKRSDEYDGLPSTFADACRHADDRARKKPRNPHLERLRFLMDDAVSFEAAYAAFDRERRKHGAPVATVDALVFALRRGIDAATDNQRRLGELNDEQMHEVAARVQNFMPHIAPAWNAADINTLISMWSKLRC